MIFVIILIIYNLAASLGVINLYMPYLIKLKSAHNLWLILSMLFHFIYAIHAFLVHSFFGRIKDVLSRLIVLKLLQLSAAHHDMLFFKNSLAFIKSFICYIYFLSFFHFS